MGSAGTGRKARRGAWGGPGRRGKGTRRGAGKVLPGPRGQAPPDAGDRRREPGGELGAGLTVIRGMLFFPWKDILLLPPAPPSRLARAGRGGPGGPRRGMHQLGLAGEPTEPGCVRGGAGRPSASAPGRAARLPAPPPAPPPARSCSRVLKPRPGPAPRGCRQLRLGPR